MGVKREGVREGGYGCVFEMVIRGRDDNCVLGLLEYG